jgi:hypothetical protein
MSNAKRARFSPPASLPEKRFLGETNRPQGSLKTVIVELDAPAVMRSLAYRRHAFARGLAASDMAFRPSGG